MITKTVEEYMNDPRILEDNAIMEAHPIIREIYAARLKIQDEREQIGWEEYEKRLSGKIEKLGLSHLLVKSAVNDSNE